MLPRRYRLPGPRLPQVLGGQEIFRDTQLLIKTLPNGLSFSRLGVIIPNRVIAKAVGRNRLKRQLLAVVDPAKITPGFDVVVLVRRPQ